MYVMYITYIVSVPGRCDGLFDCSDARVGLCCAQIGVVLEVCRHDMQCGSGSKNDLYGGEGSMRILNFSATVVLTLFALAANVNAQTDVSVALVVQASPETADAVATLPASGSGFAVGSTVYLEVWAQTQLLSGLSQVSADISFDPNQVSALSITHTAGFSLFANGTIDNVTGLIDDLSGSVPPSSPPCTPAVGVAGWSRVAEVELVVNSGSAGSVQSVASGSPIFVVAICGAFNTPTVNYLSTDLGTVDQAQVALVSLASPSASDTASVLPVSQTKFKAGDTFVVEMWAQTTASTGFSQVSSDIMFDPSVLSAISITPTATFGLFTNGTINNAVGLLDDVSGSVTVAIPPCSASVGSGTWARVAIIDMSADSIGPFSIVPMDTGSPIWVIAQCASFTLPAAAYQGVAGEAVTCLVDGDCNDSNVCTNDSCDVSNSCVFDGTGVVVACDDNDTCTTVDQCQGDFAGTCVGVTSDADGDGVPDACDPCPFDNPDDTDGDTVCDSNDICPGGNDLVDTDGDGVPDDCDNCALPNPDQADCQSNGVGDVCDIDAGTTLDSNGNGIPDQCESSPPSVAIAPHDVTKDRYLSFGPGINTGQMTALRVRRVGSTIPWYVSCTLQDAGADGKLGDLVLTAEFCAWTDAVIHVRGCEIVPGNEYLVDATLDNVGFTLSISVFTTPPQILASRQFGDAVGAFNGVEWTAPDGVVTANDIAAAVQRFQLVPSAPHLSRLDNDGNIPNGIIASNDILREVFAFAGSEFGFGVTGCLTGTCVPNCSALR